VVELRILGSLEIVVGGTMIRLDRPLERKVLATLLLDAERTVPMSRIVDAVWDDRPPDTALKQIRNCVSRLRQRLGAAGAPDDVIVTESPGYLLRLGEATLDARTFTHRVGRARELATAGQLCDAVAELRAALALWRGPALAGIGGRTTEAAAAGLDEQRLAALEECLAHELTLGRGTELVAELSTLVGENPMRERLRGQLMLALYRAGRRIDALAVYRQGRRVLVEELGLEPGSELRALEQAILADDPRLAGAGPPPTGAGSAAGPGAGSGTGPTVADPVVPAQLPADVAAFTGRQDELRFLDAQVPGTGRRGGVAICVISGAAGVGKTALAVHWAHRVRTAFGDGQLYVNLRGYALAAPMDPTEALAQFLRGLGVPAERVPVTLDEAAAMYRSLLSNRRVLVVLDNASSAEQVRPLLPGNPDCLVVVTSRDRLGALVARDGARLLPLGVLAAAEAQAVLAEMIGADRVAAEAGATGELARLCAYLPLALRIAAAQLTGRPWRIARYVEELSEGNRLAALAVHGEAETAVRVAFDLSYGRLTAPTRQLFRLLGLVPGADFTAATVAALTGGTLAEARRGLEQLTAAHLVDEPVEGRFSFHDLLREYAAERADQEDDKADLRAATGRLLAWYRHEVDAAAGLLYPEILRLPGGLPGGLPARSEPVRLPPTFDHQAALAWLDAEQSNVLAVLAVAAEHGPRAVAWLLSDALRGYFHLRMHTVDWLSAARTGLVAAELDGELAAQAAARLSLGDLHWRTSRYAEAIEHYALAADLAMRAGWLRCRGAVLGNLGNVYLQSGRLDAAVEVYRQALDIAEQTGWLAGRAANLENLGEAFWELGRLEEAAEHTLLALSAFPGGNHFAEGVARTTLGEVCHALGRLDEAAEHLARALTLHRTVGNRGGEAETLRVLALVSRDTGRPGEALDLARAALALARDAGDRRYEADALNTVATVDRVLGRYRPAIEGHQQALALAREIGNRYPEVEALVGLAVTHHELGDVGPARDHIDRAVALAHDVGYGALERQALAVQAQIVDRARLEP
jgi:DNA-binding SARP family transcriptional activator